MKDSIDEACQCIYEGKICESEEDYWASADWYGKAAELFKKLILSVEHNCEKSHNEKEKQACTKKKDLFLDEFHFYLRKARTCLTKVLNQEGDAKCEFDTQGISLLRYSEEESRKRTLVFQRIFAPEISCDRSTASIEERLARLNASMPLSTKTKHSDMERRLKELGVYVLEDHTSRIDLEPSEEEQVDAILSFANDNMLLDEKGNNTPETHGEVDMNLEVYPGVFSNKEHVEQIIKAAKEANDCESEESRDAENLHDEKGNNTPEKYGNMGMNLEVDPGDLSNEEQVERILRAAKEVNDCENEESRDAEKVSNVERHDASDGQVLKDLDLPCVEKIKEKFKGLNFFGEAAINVRREDSVNTISEQKVEKVEEVIETLLKTQTYLEEALLDSNDDSEEESSASHEDSSASNKATRKISISHETKRMETLRNAKEFLEDAIRGLENILP